MSVLVGKKAPDFKANAVVGGKIQSGFTLSQFIGKKYVILFFYPKDFTFVCPTEILAFQAAKKEFDARNVELIGCSTDTEFCHLAWTQTPRSKGGIEGVEYPLVARHEQDNRTRLRSFGGSLKNLPRRQSVRRRRNGCLPGAVSHRQEWNSPARSGKQFPARTLHGRGNQNGRCPPTF